MNNQESNNSIRQAVLEKIQSGKVRKFPRAYFMFRVLATLVISVLLLLISTFVLSFILFSFEESGELFLLGFGTQGILVFLILFPWMLFILDILLLLVLEWLIQGFKFGYRIPLLYIFLGIFGASLLFGALLNITPIHSDLLQDADRNQLPVFGGAYEHIFDHHEDLGVCRGIVMSVDQSTSTNAVLQSFVMQHNDRDHDSDDGEYVVTPAPGTTLPPVIVGDRVLVFGHPVPGPGGNEYVEAQGVQILPALPPPPAGM